MFVNRHDFMINPTSCNQQALSATVIGGGANPTNPAGYDPVTVSAPFQGDGVSGVEVRAQIRREHVRQDIESQWGEPARELDVPGGCVG